MNSNIKIFLNELASFLQNQKLNESDVHINKVYEKKGRRFLFDRGGNMFYWLDAQVPKESALELEQFNLVEDFMSQESIDLVSSDFEELFKYCDILNEFLVLEKTYIGFKPEVTEEEKDKIREHIKLIWPRSSRRRFIKR